MADFYKQYQNAPSYVKKIIDDLPDEPDYDDLAKASKKLEAKGWDMDYGLDATITDLRRKKPSKVKAKKKVKPKEPNDFDKYKDLVKRSKGLRITNQRVQVPFTDQSKAWEQYIPLDPKTGTPITTVMMGKVSKKGSVYNLDYLERSNFLGDGDSNTKTKKNDRYTQILYLTPATGSGQNFCKMASPGCIVACLSKSGRGIFENVQQARLLKSFAIQDFELFILQRIQKQILTASQSVKRNKFRNKQEVAVRLNGTSDLPFLEMMDQYGLLDAIPSNVRFYDYTKFPDKAGVKKINKFNYVVTYSRCEDYFDPRIGKFVDNMYNALDNLEKGNMVAVVFAGDKLPKYWFGYPVVDGDKRDDLMLDLNPTKGNGIVIGLRAKPPRNRKDFDKWVRDSKNFVVEIDDFNDCRSTGLITIGQPK